MKIPESLAGDAHAGVDVFLDFLLVVLVVQPFSCCVEQLVERWQQSLADRLLHIHERCVEPLGGSCSSGSLAGEPT